MGAATARVAGKRAKKLTALLAATLPRTILPRHWGCTPLKTSAAVCALHSVLRAAAAACHACPQTHVAVFTAQRVSARGAFRVQTIHGAASALKQQSCHFSGSEGDEARAPRRAQQKEPKNSASRPYI
jgi:hypothetical protein